ncbi:MAG: ester cyclase [Verrucomicrobia bacterium]|nr:ester cyclase [Prolixibacteraceae bacterium]
MIDLKRIVEQTMDAIAQHDFGKLRKMYHENYSYTGTDGHRQVGPESGVGIAELYTTAFPDLQFEIINMVTTGNFVVTEFIANGTHQGDLMGIKPTNRKVSVPICNVAEIREGKIYAEREYFDNVHLMQQLGVDVGHEHHA